MYFLYLRSLQFFYLPDLNITYAIFIALTLTIYPPDEACSVNERSLKIAEDIEEREMRIKIAKSYLLKYPNSKGKVYDAVKMKR